MKNRILILVIVFILFVTMVSGCGIDGREGTKLSEMIKKTRSVETLYIKENGEYVPYIVLGSIENNKIILLRKEALEEQRRFNDYKSLYEGSEIDNYLENEFPKRFADSFRGLLAEANIEVASEEALYKTSDETYNIKRSVFLLSYTEVGYSDTYIAPNEGRAFSCFSDDKSRIAFVNGTACGWWLRTPYTVYDSVSWSVGSSGIKTELSSNYKNGIRPAICVSDMTDVKKSEDIIAGESVYYID